VQVGGFALGARVSHPCPTDPGAPSARAANVPDAASNSRTGSYRVQPPAGRRGGESCKRQRWSWLDQEVSERGVVAARRVHFAAGSAASLSRPPPRLVSEDSSSLRTGDHWFAQREKGL